MPLSRFIQRLERREKYDYALLGIVDLLLGLNYAFLDDTHFKGKGFDGPRAILPIHIWGILYIVGGLVALVLKGSLRQISVGTVGLMVNLVFGLSFLFVFFEGINSSDITKHTSAGYSVLLVAWAIRHLMTALRDPST